MKGARTEIINTRLVICQNSFWQWLALVSGLLIILGCTPAATPAPAPQTPALPPPPTLKIISPAALSAIPAGNVTVTVAVTNFALVPAGGLIKPGEGHIHFYFDVDIPIQPGVPAVTTPETYQVTGNTTATWTNVSPGTHTFGAQLVDNGHTPLNPPVAVAITVTVR